MSDVKEIQRQNRITQQIITNYLERKLFPNRRPHNNAPSVDEIIQIPGLSDETRTLLIEKGGKNKDGDDHDPETLQSVESEHVDNVYTEEIGGRTNYRGESCTFYYLFLLEFFYFASFFLLPFFSFCD